MFKESSFSACKYIFHFKVLRKKYKVIRRKYVKYISDNVCTRCSYEIIKISFPLQNIYLHAQKSADSIGARAK